MMHVNTANDMRRGLVALLALAPLTAWKSDHKRASWTSWRAPDNDLVIVDGWVLLRSDLRGADFDTPHG